MAEDYGKSSAPGSSELDRRDFLKIGAGAACAFAGGAAAIPFIRSMSPSLDVEAQRTVEIDISDVKEGEMKTVEWQGKPIFVVHRTQEMIKKAQEYDEKGKDKGNGPEGESYKDADRAKKPEWLIVIGTCTHLGCIPLWKAGKDPGADWKAWHCPCHGSQYDFSGRIIAGPAPRNLEVPPYEFLSDTKVKLGKEA